MSQPAAMMFLFVFVTVMSSKVHASLLITPHDYPLMHYTSLISGENFTPGRPLVIMLPLAEEDLITKKVSCLIEELHKSGRWPILVFNISYEMNGNMYTEIHQHYSYIILISGPCQEWEQNILGFQKQLSALSEGKLKESWNPSARFLVPVMANCTNFESTNTSRAILSHLWIYEISDAVVLFLKSNEKGGKDLKQNTNDSAQGSYLELHTWHPYENSDRCNPAEGTVPVKVFTVRNLIEITKSEIFKGYLEKNYHKCKVAVHAEIAPPFVSLSKSVWYKDSENQHVYQDGWEIELLRIIGKSINVSLDIIVGNEKKYQGDLPTIHVGGYDTVSSRIQVIKNCTRSYYTDRFVWYTPCKVKYERWSRFFKIFSVDMWICLALSLVLAVFTVSCISNYRHKSHLHESNSYSNIFSVSINITAVLLSVSVNTQPHSAPLRLFFFCWVCYSVAISTVFQAYFTTFLIEPEHEEPIKNIDQILICERKFGFTKFYVFLFSKIFDSVDSAILKNAVLCPHEDTCVMWATVYHNISTIIDDFNVENYRKIGYWTDEYYRPLLCELEDGVFATYGYAFIVKNGRRLLELINDVIVHVDKGGIFMHIKKRILEKEKMESTFSSFTFADTYSAISIRNLQTVFYLLTLGYVSAVVCFVTEIMWHRYRSRGRGPTSTSVTDGHT